MWTTGNAVSYPDLEETSRMQACELDVMGTDPTGYMFEWIVDQSGRHVWVDMKYLGLAYVSPFAPRAPADYHIGEELGDDSGVGASILDTSLAYTYLIYGSSRGLLTCERGSPLAHLCVLAYQAGVGVLVPEVD